VVFPIDFNLLQSFGSGWMVQVRPPLARFNIMLQHFFSFIARESGTVGPFQISQTRRLHVRSPLAGFLEIIVQQPGMAD